MMDCRLVPGQDEVTIHQSGRAPCSTDVRGHVAGRHLVDVGLSVDVYPVGHAEQCSVTEANGIKPFTTGHACMPCTGRPHNQTLPASSSQYAVRSLPRQTIKPLAPLMLVSYHLKADARHISKACQKKVSIYRI